MRPPESFSTFSIHGLCIDSHTFDVGAMKVWNLSVTDCCARPVRAGAPSAAATLDLRMVLRWIMTVSRVAKVGTLAGKQAGCHGVIPKWSGHESHQPER